MKHYEVVCAVIQREDGKIFCCKRGKGALKGKWEFPGGKIETGETPEQAIVREIKEELSATIKPVKYLGEVSHEYHFDDESLDFSLNMKAFFCQMVEGDLILSEHTEYDWVEEKNLIKKDFAQADVKVLNM